MNSVVDHYLAKAIVGVKKRTVNKTFREESEDASNDSSSFSWKDNWMNIAVAIIGIGIVLMVGFLVISNVRSALPEVQSATPGMDSTTHSLASAQTTIFSAFALIAVGIIVITAFGLISVFK